MTRRQRTYRRPAAAVADCSPPALGTEAKHDALQLVTGTLGAVAGAGGFLLFAGAAVLATRFHSVHVSGVLAASEVSRDYLLGLGAQTALAKVPYGVAALVVMGACAGFGSSALGRWPWARWLLGVVAATIAVVLLLALRVWFPLALLMGAEASVAFGLTKTTWPARVGGAALVVVAITVAQEADRLSFPYERAVITLRPQINAATIFGTSDASDFHLPRYRRDDRDCGAGKPRICGLLLSSDAAAVTVAPLYLTDPATGAHPVVTIDRADVASVAVYTVSTQDSVTIRNRRRPLYCRIPLTGSCGE